MMNEFDKDEIIRKKILRSRADFHFDLQRFADDLNYIDANGIEQTISDYTILDGSKTTLNEGWYVVNSDITIADTLTFNGDTHLILADDAKLTINSNIECIFVDNGTLNIYGQMLGTGKLDATGDSNGIYANNINLSWTNATDFIDASRNGLLHFRSSRFFFLLLSNFLFQCVMTFFESFRLQKIPKWLMDKQPCWKNITFGRCGLFLHKGTY